MQRLIDLLFTPRCIGCSQIGEHLCQNCERHLVPISSNRFAGYESISTAGDYGGWLRDALIEYKSGNKKISNGLSLVITGTLLATRLPQPLTLVPIPTSREKIAERGFDSLQEILKSIELDPVRYPIKLGQLQVRAGVKDQVGLSAQERKRNLLGAFQSVSQISGNVCVIDDVITTGATLNAARTALKLAGAQRIFGVAICGSKQWR
jgi:ComF family protein